MFEVLVVAGHNDTQVPPSILDLTLPLISSKGSLLLG